VRDQCAAAGVPFFFKQWGEWTTTPAPRTAVWHAISLTQKVLLANRDGGGYVWMHRVGRKAAGRLLDGRTHDELPWSEQCPT